MTNVLQMLFHPGQYSDPLSSLTCQYTLSEQLVLGQLMNACLHSMLHSSFSHTAKTYTQIHHVFHAIKDSWGPPQEEEAIRAQLNYKILMGITSYNRPKLLVQCVNAIIKQTYKAYLYEVCHVFLR